MSTCKPSIAPWALLAETPRIPIPQQLWPFRGILAIGVVILAVWMIRRAAFPQTLKLTRVPGRPNHLSLLHSLALLFFFYLLHSSRMMIFQPTKSRPLPSVEQIQLILIHIPLVQLIFLAACLLVAGEAFRHGRKLGLGLTLRRWRLDVLRGLVAFFAVIPICLLLLAAGQYFFPDFARAHELLLYLRQVAPAWRSLVVLSAVILAPIGEEVFWRGIFQTSLRSVGAGPWPAILITSGIFAIVHLNVLHALPLFVLSVALGYNYERTGRLLPSIVLHAAFNALFTIMTLLELSELPR